MGDEMTRKCSIKKHGGGKACACGCYGQKVNKVPYPYQDNEKMIGKAKKWKKKNGIRMLRKKKGE
jgi:hypothetical protein